MLNRFGCRWRLDGCGVVSEIHSSRTESMTVCILSHMILSHLKRRRIPMTMCLGHIPDDAVVLGQYRDKEAMVDGPLLK